MNFFIVSYIVYILAVNLYSFLLIKSMRDDFKKTGEINRSADGKLILTALIGGAITIYICMFIMRYRTKSIILMILMPLLAVVNVYVSIFALRSGYAYFIP